LVFSLVTRRHHVSKPRRSLHVVTNTLASVEPLENSGFAPIVQSSLFLISALNQQPTYPRHGPDGSCLELHCWQFHQYWSRNTGAVRTKLEETDFCAKAYGLLKKRLLFRLPLIRRRRMVSGRPRYAGLSIEILAVGPALDCIVLPEKATLSQDG